MDANLRGSPSLVGRWIAKDNRRSAKIQCALRPGVQIPLPARRIGIMKIVTYDDVDPVDVDLLTSTVFGRGFTELSAGIGNVIQRSLQDFVA